eukprot:NODE_491_length_1690_cov_32.686167_g407_i0.p1 GENE.NODE_491_length_1690_cov_32.686167_g407_i0~~NODE_491_length_1690_cov_32.686167_g407_i0.p1  ORF type:complete len:237 (+),score=36.49 NODE_491_length_1690_cov_32.686167_g407_i0:31-741(+)
MGEERKRSKDEDAPLYQAPSRELDEEEKALQLKRQKKKQEQSKAKLEFSKSGRIVKGRGARRFQTPSPDRDAHRHGRHPFPPFWDPRGYDRHHRHGDIPPWFSGMDRCCQKNWVEELREKQTNKKRYARERGRDRERPKRRRSKGWPSLQVHQPKHVAISVATQFSFWTRCMWRGSWVGVYHPLLQNGPSTYLKGVYEKAREGVPLGVRVVPPPKTLFFSADIPPGVVTDWFSLSR